VIVENKGKKIWKFMNKEEIIKHAEKSPGFNSTYSPWKEVNDPDLIMWLKTALKRL
jgi:recombinational DNA repair protein RecT